MTTLTSSELLTYLHACGIETFVAVHFEPGDKRATIRFMDQSEFGLAAKALREHSDIVDVVASSDEPTINVAFKPPFVSAETRYRQLAEAAYSHTHSRPRRATTEWPRFA